MGYGLYMREHYLYILSTGQTQLGTDPCHEDFALAAKGFLTILNLDTRELYVLNGWIPLS